MKNKKFVKFLVQPFLIAAGLTISVLPFISGYFSNYKAKVTKIGFIEKTGGMDCWEDLFNDGESELIAWFLNTEGKAALRISNQSDFLIDQHVFNGESIILRNPPGFFDLNRNGLPEIYVFYHRKDSLFLNYIEYSKNSTKIIGNEKFIADVSNTDGEIDYGSSFAIPTDFDNDSLCELIFTVNVGFPVVPRSIYIYYPFTGKLIASDFLGANTDISYITDINQDGKKEIICNQYAPGNLHDSLYFGHNDQYVRLLILNNNLKPIFDPPKFKNEYSKLYVSPVKKDSGCYLLAFLRNFEKSEGNNILMTYKTDGTLLKSKIIRDQNEIYEFSLIRNDEISPHFQILDNYGELVTYNENLEIIKKVFLDVPNGKLTELDIDQDGINENIILSESKYNVTIFQKGFYYPVGVSFMNENPLISMVYLKKNKNRANEISLQFGERDVLVSYERNNLYFLKFLFYFLIYFFLTGFFYLLRYLQQLSMRERYRAERKVSELQLLLMRNQLSPHFLFNAINSISYQLMEKNPEAANNNVIRLSKLIRNNLVSSERFSRTLKEELETSTAYIEIVRSQIEESFSYNVDIEPGTDTETEVPVMIVQNYLENAVKHGVRSMGAKGKILIQVMQEEQYLFILITDNGIGRTQSAKQAEKPDSTGKGLTLMQQFFDIVNKYSELKISAVLTDLFDNDGSPSGTRVKISIPLKIKYKIYDQ